MSRRQKKSLARILGALVLLIAVLLLPLDGWWRLAAFAIPYLLVGWDVLWAAIRNILHGQVFDEKFLMAIATIGAFVLGEYLEAVAVMLFYQVGELFQSIAVGKSRRNIAALMDIRPDTAVVLRDGKEVTLPPEEVLAGEVVLVRPGEKIPLDGTILSGQTAVNTSALTGESMPSDACVGDKVLSGSINLTGVITVQTSGSFSESTVSKILELVENASEKKAKVDNFITRFARYYTPCVVISAVLLGLLPSLFDGRWSVWVGRALTFLVVSCPCALVVSVPLSFFGGIGGASKAGILIKGASYLEILAKVDTVVFDKTGTLTKGCFTVTSICPVEGTPEDLLSLAAAAEQNSNHPIARSILAACKKPIDGSRIGEVSELTGRGIRAQIDDKYVYAGNLRLMEEIGAQAEPVEETGTVIYLACEGQYLGYLVVCDVEKPDAKSAIARLKKLGVRKTVMLTGDSRAIGEAVAKALDIDEVHTELLPADKVTAVEALLTGKPSLAFVGDGINDAPVLSRADVGIAMGALGSDAAIEAADVVLMDDKLSKLPQAIRIARKTMAIVTENIVFALAVKLLVLLLSALGLVGMWIAIFADVGVMVLAVLNAMRSMNVAQKG